MRKASLAETATVRAHANPRRARAQTQARETVEHELRRRSSLGSSVSTCGSIALIHEASVAENAAIAAAAAAAAVSDGQIAALEEQLRGVRVALNESRRECEAAVAARVRAEEKLVAQGCDFEARVAELNAEHAAKSASFAEQLAQLKVQHSAGAMRLCAYPARPGHAQKSMAERENQIAERDSQIQELNATIAAMQAPLAARVAQKNFASPAPAAKPDAAEFDTPPLAQDSPIGSPLTGKKDDMFLSADKFLAREESTHTAGRPSVSPTPEQRRVSAVKVQALFRGHLERKAIDLERRLSQIPLSSPCTPALKAANHRSAAVEADSPPLSAVSSDQPFADRLADVDSERKAPAPQLASTLKSAMKTPAVPAASGKTAASATTTAAKPSKLPAPRVVTTAASSRIPRFGTGTQSLPSPSSAAAPVTSAPMSGPPVTDDAIIKCTVGEIKKARATLRDSEVNWSLRVKSINRVRERVHRRVVWCQQSIRVLYVSAV